MKNISLNFNYIHQTERAAELEAHLEQIAPCDLSIQYRLELRDIITRLTLSQEIASDTDAIRNTRAELLKLKNNLARRTKFNEDLTLKALVSLSPITQALLFSALALMLRNDVDNWTQVDFNDCRHTARLGDSINNAISKITNAQGRPIHADMDEFLLSLGRLYQTVTGHPGSAQAHYDNQPRNGFEHFLYLGFKITRPGYGYPTMLKAWQRAVSRQT